MGESGPAGLTCFGDCFAGAGLPLGVAEGDLAARGGSARLCGVKFTFGDGGATPVTGVVADDFGTEGSRDLGGDSAVSGLLAVTSVALVSRLFSSTAPSPAECCCVLDFLTSRTLVVDSEVSLFKLFDFAELISIVSGAAVPTESCSGLLDTAASRTSGDKFSLNTLAPAISSVSV